MKKWPGSGGRRGRGAIAVEFAIVLPVIMIFMTGLLFLGRFFWFYTVAEKAAHDAARFLATASAAEMKTFAGGGQPAIVEAAREIARTELSDLPMTEMGGAGITVLCYGSTWDLCYGTSVPSKILVRITVPVTDPFFDGFTGDLTNGGYFFFNTQALTDYVGN
jgi:hypothetical protein